MSTVQELLKRGVCWHQRRLYMKRLQLDSAYESDWFDITAYVRRFGMIQKAFGDEVFLGSMQIDGFTIALNNSGRRFNDEKEYGSLFRGYLTRYRTKFKIETTFIDDDDSEVAGLTYYAIMYADPEINADGDMEFSVSTMLKVFQNYPASGIDGSGSPSTATLIDRLVKKTQNGARIFDQFFEGANDAARYSINPSALSVTTISSPLVLQNQSVWDKIVDYSFIDQFFGYVNAAGGFVWDKKTNAGSLVWEFHGAGSSGGNYGVNIIEIIREKSGFENLWNRIAIEYDDETFEVSQSDWTPGDGSDRDKYGERTFSHPLKELTSGEAATVAAAIRSRYETLKREWTIRTKYTPHLELKDKVSLTYFGEVTVEDAFVVGFSRLGTTTPQDYLGGRGGSYNLNGVVCLIIAMAHDLDNMESNFVLREV